MSAMTIAYDFLDYFDRHDKSMKDKAEYLVTWIKESPELFQSIDIHAKIREKQLEYLTMYSELVRRFSAGELSVDDFIIGGDWLVKMSEDVKTIAVKW